MPSGPENPNWKTLANLSWDKYPLRTCRSLHACEICGKDITLGERYRDGGYRRRAHETCLTTGEWAPITKAESQ